MKSLLPENRGQQPKYKRSRKYRLSKKFRKPQRKRHPYFALGNPHGDTWFKREPRAAWLWAKERYLKEELSQCEISRRIGVPLHTLRYWIYGFSKCLKGALADGRPHLWAVEKYELEQKLEKEIMEAKKKQFCELREKILEKCRSLVDNIAIEKATQIKDLLDLIQALVKVDYMTRLEAHEPTHIVEGAQKLTPQQVLKQLVEADPLVDYSKLFKEIESSDEFKHFAGLDLKTELPN